MRTLVLLAFALAAAGPASGALMCQSVKTNVNGNGERYLGVSPGVASAVRRGVLCGVFCREAEASTARVDGDLSPLRPPTSLFSLSYPLKTPHTLTTRLPHPSNPHTRTGRVRRPV